MASGETKKQNSHRKGTANQINMPGDNERATHGDQNMSSRGKLIVNIEVDFSDLVGMRNRSREKLKKAFSGQQKPKYKGGPTKKQKDKASRNEASDAVRNDHNASANEDLFANVFSFAFRAAQPPN